VNRPIVWTGHLDCLTRPTEIAIENFSRRYHTHRPRCLIQCGEQSLNSLGADLFECLSDILRDLFHAARVATHTRLEPPLFGFGGPRGGCGRIVRPRFAITNTPLNCPARRPAGNNSTSAPIAPSPAVKGSDYKQRSRQTPLPEPVRASLNDCHLSTPHVKTPSNSTLARIVGGPDLSKFVWNY
jgi:hypothetical protein